jgi:carboxypeptidase C (cathepsin A)
MGYETVIDSLETKFTKEYRAQNFTEYKVAGQVAGLYKNAGTFSYLRVYGAGHQVPAYSYGTFDTGLARVRN